MNIDERMQALHVNIESLHANLGELYDSVREFRSATEKSFQALGEAVSKLQSAGENLWNIANAHEKRLDRYEVTVVAFQEDVRDIKTELRAIRERLEGFGDGSKLQ
jgi:prefoldin subunit 5